MATFFESAVELLNSSGFSISEAGSIHMPVLEFNLKREESLQLVLETTVPDSAYSPREGPPLGTLEINTNKICLKAPSGAEAVLHGVATRRVVTGISTAAGDVLNETIRVHRMHVTLGPAEQGAYTVEWLANVRQRAAVWPNFLSTTRSIMERPTVTLNDQGIVLDGFGHPKSSALRAVKFSVLDGDLYLCALEERDAPGVQHPGCLIYSGTPNDETRRTVRNALSLALGLYLVELGHTVYDSGWRVVSAFARSPYTLGRRAFDIPPCLFSPLGPMYRDEIQSARLSRAVDSLISFFGAEDLGHLAWAYWHARTAAIHVAPAQYGAAIESLIKTFECHNPNVLPSKILGDSEWAVLEKAARTALKEKEVASDKADVVMSKFARSNEVSAPAKFKAMAKRLGMELSTRETNAWKRRNSGAHGGAIAESEQIAAIEDMKFLRGLFHRLTLKLSGAADEYVDHCTLGHPFRPLAEPPTA